MYRDIRRRKLLFNRLYVKLITIFLQVNSISFYNSKFYQIDEISLGHFFSNSRTFVIFPKKRSRINNKFFYAHATISNPIIHKQKSYLLKIT